MVFRYGSVSDARQIAETYCEAFPECLLFKHKQRKSCFHRYKLVFPAASHRKQSSACSR